VTGEYVVGVRGLGQEVLVAQRAGAYDRAYAWALLTGLLGLGINVVFQALERRYLRWHPSQAERVRPGGRLSGAR
jgi:ABC-type nitrate/sulfonate/bicarbonate transport system permease component